MNTKIILDIPISLLSNIELLSKLTGLSVPAILREAIWREANHFKPFVKELMEKDYIDNESKNCVNLIRYSARS